MLLSALKALLNALANGNARHNDNEFGQPIATIKLVDGTNIDISFTRARFHFDGKIAQMPVGSNARRSERVAFLDCMQVALELGGRETKSVGMAHLYDLTLIEAGAHLCDKIGVHELLTAKQVADSVDGFDLMLLVRRIFNFQSHALYRPQLYLVTGPLLHTLKRLNGIKLECIGEDRVTHEHTSWFHIGDSIERFQGEPVR